MLSPESLERLLSGIALLAAAELGLPPLEWSVEANPDSLSAEKLEIMAHSGVTRLSIGVQSLEPEELRLLGRVHGPEEALAAVRLAADSGFAVSADLMAGLPRLGSGQGPRRGPRRGTRRLDGPARYAKELVAAGASHISAYDLTLEEGTPLERRSDELEFPTEDEAWEERRLLEESLSGLGFRRYEISNYAPFGRECLHNLAYWRMDSYLGAGPGAVSTIALSGGTSLRIEEAKDAASYGRLRAESATETLIGFKDSAFEAIMMAFRSSFGLDLGAFRERFGLDAEELLEGSLAAWKSRIVKGEAWPPAYRSEASAASDGRDDGRCLALDGEGMDLLNRFLGDCLEEIDAKLGPGLDARPRSR